MANEPPTPHPTFVNAESTLSLFPFHRFLDASTRYPTREVIDVWQGPIPVNRPSARSHSIDSWTRRGSIQRGKCVDFLEGPIQAGPRSIKEEDMEEASATEKRVDWGWEVEKGDEARIIRRAVGHTKRSKHGRTFPPSSDYDPSPAWLFWRLGDSS